MLSRTHRGQPLGDPCPWGRGRRLGGISEKGRHIRRCLLLRSKTRIGLYRRARLTGRGGNGGAGAPEQAQVKGRGRPGRALLRRLRRLRLCGGCPGENGRQRQENPHSFGRAGFLSAVIHAFIQVEAIANARGGRANQGAAIRRFRPAARSITFENTPYLPPKKALKRSPDSAFCGIYLRY